MPNYYNNPSYGNNPQYMANYQNNSYGYYPQNQQGAYQNYNNSGNAGGVGIIWVQGEAGAKAYPIPPGSNCMLLDSESPTFYIKSVDANGFPSPLKIYDYTERSNYQLTSSGNMQSSQFSSDPTSRAIDAQHFSQDYVSKKEFDELKKMIEEMSASFRTHNNQQASNNRGNK